MALGVVKIGLAGMNTTRSSLLRDKRWAAPPVYRPLHLTSYPNESYHGRTGQHGDPC